MGRNYHFIVLICLTAASKLMLPISASAIIENELQDDISMWEQISNTMSEKQGYDSSPGRGISSKRKRQTNGLGDMTVLDYVYAVIPKNMDVIENMGVWKTYAELVFKYVDTNNDGEISKQELEDKMKHLLELYIDFIDSNEDGFLQFTDFLKFKVSTFDPILDEIFAIDDSLNIDIKDLPLPFSEIASKFDQNTDGKLSKDEIKNFFRKVMEKIDDNNDDMVDRKEAMKFNRDVGLSTTDNSDEVFTKFEALFNVFIRDMIDTNNDGKLSKDEARNVVGITLNKVMEKIQSREVQSALQDYGESNQILTNNGLPQNTEDVAEKMKQWLMDLGTEETPRSHGIGDHNKFLEKTTLILLALLVSTRRP